MARTKSRPVCLSPVDRQALTAITRTGSHPAQQVRRARVLLELDENDPGRAGPVPTQEVVAERAGVHVDTVVKTGLGPVWMLLLMSSGDRDVLAC